MHPNHLERRRASCVLWRHHTAYVTCCTFSCNHARCVRGGSILPPITVFFEVAMLRPAGMTRRWFESSTSTIVRSANSLVYANCKILRAQRFSDRPAILKPSKIDSSLSVVVSDSYKRSQLLCLPSPGLRIDGADTDEICRPQP